MSLAYCIAVYMMSKGKASMAIATVLAFHTFARGGEILQVRVCDVLDINDVRTCRENAEMGVLLRDTKTGKNQFVTITDPQLVRLHKLTRFPDPKTRLFPFSQKTWLTWINKACQHLNIEQHFVVHSLRHGGATQALMTGMPLQDIQHRGRWKSYDSMKTYLQQGRALLIMKSLPQNVTSAGPVLASHTLQAFRLAGRHARSSLHI